MSYPILNVDVVVNCTKIYIYVWGWLGKLMKLWFWRNNTLFEGPHFGITHGDIAGYTSHRDPSTGWVIASAWSECHMGWLVIGTNFGQYPLRWCFLRCNSQQKDAETWCITAKCWDLTFLHLLEGCYNLYKSFSTVDICDDASDIDLILVKKTNVVPFQNGWFRGLQDAGITILLGSFHQHIRSFPWYPSWMFFFKKMMITRGTPKKSSEPPQKRN